jgi:acyl dehydratase
MLAVSDGGGLWGSARLDDPRIRRNASGDEEWEMTVARYLEDFDAGQTFVTGTVTVEPEQIWAFAAEFDPQPFHLDDVAARASLFGGLVASGWHTAALTMKLLVGSELRIAGGLVGTGVEELRGPRPMRPGDTLRVEGEVLDVRLSKSRPDRGVVKLRAATRNQDSHPVLVMVTSLIVPRRPS